VTQQRGGPGHCSSPSSATNVTIQRGIRNEFPYLGRVGPAAWAVFRLVGGNGIGRLAGRARRPGTAASPGTRRCTQGQEGCADTRAGRANARRPGRTSRRRRTAGCRWTAPEQQVQLTYAPWTKFCLKGQDANAKQVCITGKDGRIESGQPVIAAVIIEPEGETKKILRVTLPLGMQLVHGTRVIIDSNPPAQSPYVLCLQNGCMSDYEVTPELLANLKKGQNLVVQAINSNGAPLILPLPLTEAGGGFAKAYDGPPTDPKKLEEANRKLQEELQKRANDARQKLESAQPPTAAMTPDPTAK
jgi:invasion protein IalB